MSKRKNLLADYLKTISLNKEIKRLKEMSTRLQNSYRSPIANFKGVSFNGIISIRKTFSDVVLHRMKIHLRQNN